MDLFKEIMVYLFAYGAGYALGAWITLRVIAKKDRE